MREIFTKVGQSIRENSVVVDFLCSLFSGEVGKLDGVEYKDAQAPKTAGREVHHN